MAENLKTTQYRNGDEIFHLHEDSLTNIDSLGFYTYYANDEGNKDIFGNLYNWYAVIDSRNVAPEDWHIPTDEEWKELEIFLGMSQTEVDNVYWRGTTEGSKIKEIGTMHWLSDWNNPTNESGFTALGSGYYAIYGYLDQFDLGIFWTSTEFDDHNSWTRTIADDPRIYRNMDNKFYGYSIRCVKD